MPQVLMGQMIDFLAMITIARLCRVGVHNDNNNIRYTGAPSQAPSGRLWALGLAAGLAVTMASVGPAAAHGEKSQAAFLRMRTLNWYDLKWSKTSVQVNEEYEITGKLHIMNAWPAAVHVPDRAFVNVGQPGAVANREGVWVGGQFTPGPCCSR